MLAASLSKMLGKCSFVALTCGQLFDLYVLEDALKV